MPSCNPSQNEYSKRQIHALSPLQHPGGSDKERMIKKSLLVADDDAEILKLVEEAFHSSDVDVLKAQDGVEALKRFDASSAAIDVLLVDELMPRLNGLELARAVLARHPGTKVILMSGMAEESPAPYASAPSKIRYMRKPFTLKVLRQTVQEELNT